MIGVVINRGGYMSQRRERSVPLGKGERLSFFLARSVAINTIQRLAAGNSGNNADLVAVLQWRFLVLKEANIFFIDVNIDEAADSAVLVEQSFFDTGETRLQLRNDGSDNIGVDFDQLLVVGELPERCWNANFGWH